MTEAELREMDKRIHELLYPGCEIKPGVTFGPQLSLSGWVTFCSGGGWRPVPCYTTDILAWEPVYAARPEWRWSISDSVDGTETHVWLMGVGYYRSIPKGSGPAAWALGMARCVIAWAEGRGEQ